MGRDARSPRPCQAVHDAPFAPRHVRFAREGVQRADIVRRDAGAAPDAPGSGRHQARVHPLREVGAHGGRRRQLRRNPKRRRRSCFRASPNSSTPTTDSRFGRETPKTTSRNALQPLSMRVRRISTLKKWVNSRTPPDRRPEHRLCKARP